MFILVCFLLFPLLNFSWGVFLLHIYIFVKCCARKDLDASIARKAVRKTLSVCPRTSGNQRGQRQKGTERGATVLWEWHSERRMVPHETRRRPNISLPQNISWSSSSPFETGRENRKTSTFGTGELWKHWQWRVWEHFRLMALCSPQPLMMNNNLTQPIAFRG